MSFIYDPNAQQDKLYIGEPISAEDNSLIALKNAMTAASLGRGFVPSMPMFPKIDLLFDESGRFVNKFSSYAGLSEERVVHFKQSNRTYLMILHGDTLIFDDELDVGQEGNIIMYGEDRSEKRRTQRLVDVMYQGILPDGSNIARFHYEDIKNWEELPDRYLVMVEFDRVKKAPKGMATLDEHLKSSPLLEMRLGGPENAYDLSQGFKEYLGIEAFECAHDFELRGDKTGRGKFIWITRKGFSTQPSNYPGNFIAFAQEDVDPRFEEGQENAFFSRLNKMGVGEIAFPFRETKFEGYPAVQRPFWK